MDVFLLSIMGFEASNNSHRFQIVAKIVSSTEGHTTLWVKREKKKEAKRRFGHINLRFVWPFWDKLFFTQTNWFFYALNNCFGEWFLLTVRFSCFVSKYLADVLNVFASHFKSITFCKHLQLIIKSDLHVVFFFQLTISMGPMIFKTTPWWV